MHSLALNITHRGKELQLLCTHKCARQTAYHYIVHKLNSNWSVLAAGRPHKTHSHASCGDHQQKTEKNAYSPFLHAHDSINSVSPRTSAPHPCRSPDGPRRVWMVVVRWWWRRRVSMVSYCAVVLRACVQHYKRYFPVCAIVHARSRFLLSRTAFVCVCTQYIIVTPLKGKPCFKWIARSHTHTQTTLATSTSTCMRTLFVIILWAIDMCEHTRCHTHTSRGLYTVEFSHVQIRHTSIDSVHACMCIGVDNIIRYRRICWMGETMTQVKQKRVHRQSRPGPGHIIKEFCMDTHKHICMCLSVYKTHNMGYVSERASHAQRIKYTDNPLPRQYLSNTKFSARHQSTFRKCLSKMIINCVRCICAHEYIHKNTAYRTSHTQNTIIHQHEQHTRMYVHARVSAMMMPHDGDRRGDVCVGGALLLAGMSSSNELSTQVKSNIGVTNLLDFLV